MDTGRRKSSTKLKLENGDNLQDSDPNDVATLLKQWLRELPEPLIPTYLQDLFIRCGNLESETSRISAYLLAYQLLPSDHQIAMKHLLRFLSNIALNSENNKMGTNNLALIMAPNIFVPEGVDKSTNDMVYKYTEIVETLIEISARFGETPQTLFPKGSMIQSDMPSSYIPDKYSMKSKRKSRTGHIQDIFGGLKKKLAVQNLSVTPKNIIKEGLELRSPIPRSASKRKAEPEPNISTPKRKKYTKSIAGLESPTLETHRSKGVHTVKEKTSCHKRRKSFRTLWFCKKVQNRDLKQNLELNGLFTPDSNLKEKKQGFNFILNDSIELRNMSSQFDSLNNSALKSEESISNQAYILDKTLYRTESFSSKSDDEAAKYRNSGKWLEENNSEASIKSFSHKNTSQVTPPRSHHSLSLHDAFSIKSNRGTSPEIKHSENKETQSKTIESFKNSNVCLNSNDYFCNKKYCTNKTDTSLTEKSRQDSLNEPLPDYSESSQIAQNLSTDEFSSSILPNLVKSSSPIPNQNNCQCSETQSLDLSLNILLQNFCLSPPNKSQEIYQKIDLSSSQYNSQLNLNTLRASPGQQNRTYKERIPRTTSNSNSCISRIKKFPEATGPISVSSNQAVCKLEIPTHEKNHSKIDIPCNLTKSIQINEPSKFGIDQTDSSNSNCTTPNISSIKTSSDNFKASSSNLFASNNGFCENSGIDIITEESNMNSENSDATNNSSISWEDSHKYSGLFIDDGNEETPHKRASISKILIENSGNVQSKINLYDSKLKTSSACNSNSSTSRRCPTEEAKLFRASSEKYPSGHRYKQLKVFNTNSCDSDRH